MDAARRKTTPAEFGAILVLSCLLVVASWLGKLPYSLTETFGFVTGAACVYLVVREDVWNFPIGIANCVLYLVLFLQSRLYNDAGLQVVYIFLGFQGWYWWLRGGEQKTALKVGRSSASLLLGVGLAVAAATVALRYGTAYLTSVLHVAGSSAPWLDAFTTALSLGAQYLLNRKLLENWYLWIAVDAIYVPLYISRDLKLTAILYVVFLILAVAGAISWRKSHKAGLEVDVPGHPGDVVLASADGDTGA